MLSRHDVPIGPDAAVFAIRESMKAYAAGAR